MSEFTRTGTFLNAEQIEKVGEAYQTASTGFDALSQAIEAAFAGTPVKEALAEAQGSLDSP